MPLAPSQIPPATGWTCKEIRDALLFEVHCQICRTSLRWVFVLTHADWPSELQVGCECARHRCHPDFDCVGAISRADRLRRFCNPERWRRSANGNPTRNAGALHVTIFERNGMFLYVINEKDQPALFPCGGFLSADAAMVGAFERIEQCKGDVR